MKDRILYLTRNGLLEPLGQSQILSYLVPLSADYTFHIVSFEKQKDLADEGRLMHIRNMCEEHSISWTPLTYGQGKRRAGILSGFSELVKTTSRIVKEENVRIIHARSYFPAFVALAIQKLHGVPFVFDMRALWPEELVVSGRLRKGALPYKVIKYLEKLCLEKASGIVSLTAAAAHHLSEVHPALHLSRKISVIPTCTNTERFGQKTTSNDPTALTISCFGSLLSGWFKIEVLAKVVKEILSNYPETKFEILTRDDKSAVRSKVDPEAQWPHRLSITSVPFQDMPLRMQHHAGSVFFYESDISRLGSFPTRMGESLSVGVPVLANPCVADVASIIDTDKVGVILDDFSDAAVALACREFISLIKEADIIERCRKVAEEKFSLESGVESYAAIYSSILHP